MYALSSMRSMRTHIQYTLEYILYMYIPDTYTLSVYTMCVRMHAIGYLSALIAQCYE
jgi:hypothetical protein